MGADRFKDSFVKLVAPIECRWAGPASHVTIVGRTESGGRAYLTLVGATLPGSPPSGFTEAAPDALAQLPARIERGSVEQLDGGRCRISAPDREWMIEVSRFLLHLDASPAFYAALPPRPVPFAKRLFWRIVLGMAGSPLGRWLLGR